MSNYVTEIGVHIDRLHFDIEFRKWGVNPRLAWLRGPCGDPSVEANSTIDNDYTRKWNVVFDKESGIYVYAPCFIFWVCWFGYTLDKERREGRKKNG